MGLLTWWERLPEIPSQRAAVRRVTYIDGYAFPRIVLERFKRGHPELDDNGLDVVQQAARQWFRVIACAPDLPCAMPSIAVDDLWHAFALQTPDYAEFCPLAIGRFLHYQPNAAAPTRMQAAKQNQQLLSTLRRAQALEGLTAEGALPLLFRVDGVVGVAGGRHYVHCPGWRTCAAVEPGVVCLRHLSPLLAVRTGTAGAGGVATISGADWVDSASWTSDWGGGDWGGGDWGGGGWGGGDGGGGG